MAMWNPWRGCHKISIGCENCFIHQGDQKKGVDTNKIIKLKNFNAPLEKNQNGTYKIKPGSTVFLGFSTDFLIEDADPWRAECWDMIRIRNDLNFIFLTKRIDRFTSVIPLDWNESFNHVAVGVSVSNQKTVDDKLSIFNNLNIKHKNIILQPLIESVKIEDYLDGVELVIVGGEYGKNARPMNYDWVLDIREQCIKHKVKFEFRQCSTYFIKEGKEYKLKYHELSKQAKKANINYTP